jgi:hypothetical protein
MAIACSSNDPPKDLIEQEIMVDIMIDIHLAEAGIQDLRLQKDSAEKVFAAQEKFILKKYDVSDSSFIKSYNFYLENPEIMEQMYTAIIDSLSLKQVLLRESDSE